MLDMNQPTGGECPRHFFDVSSRLVKERLASMRRGVRELKHADIADRAIGSTKDDLFRVAAQNYPLRRRRWLHGQRGKTNCRFQVAGVHG
jgi:hypothetical protein